MSAIILDVSARSVPLCTAGECGARLEAEAIRHARLVERINRLYHEWTADRFDADHLQRHRIEGRFWRWVGQTVLSSLRQEDGAGVWVLDIACGSGFVLQQLAPYLTSRDRTVGIDLSGSSLKRAHNKWSHGEDPRPAETRARGDQPDGGAAPFASSVARGTQLPFAPASLDLVTVNASLHHFAQPDAMLREADRVLRPGGYLVIGFEPNARYFRSGVLTWLGRRLDQIAWYASPRQNARRLRRRWCVDNPCAPVVRSTDHESDEVVAGRIAQQLAGEGFCSTPLSARTILDLLDAHSRSCPENRGLDLDRLLFAYLPQYAMIHPRSSDYLGTSLRRCRWLRACVDACARILWPQSGCLVSCIARKREVAQ